jgi:ribosomal protein L11 methyltransferase
VEAEAPDIDWVQTVKDMWQPIAVGQTWYLVPEWSDEAAPAGRRRLTIHPGMASGTGLHPATQLALEMLESTVRQGDRVLDVGTGTGILADAARLMGAGVVVGCDIDLEAAVIARRNLPEGVGVFAGSVRSVVSGAFDVIVANLSAVTLKAIGGELLRCRKEGGRCILSGIRKEEISLVGAIPGAKVSSTLMLGGWVSLEL